MLHIETFSRDYKVRLLTLEDAQTVLKVENGNPQYYLYCPPAPSVQGFMDDLTALPPNKTLEDKYFFGYFDATSRESTEAELVAIVDLITAYTNAKTAFIGFFMMNEKYQGKGEGSRIIHELLGKLLEAGFEYVRLGYMKGNEQSRTFWEKNGFMPTGVETDNGQGTVVVMQRKLDSAIRKVQQGDAKTLAYVQTESWKAAFKGIVPADLLTKYTEITCAENMYTRLLEENIGNGYILEINGNPHCIAYWDATREKDMPGYAELICIHSLQNKWHQGYGSQMMSRVLYDIRKADYKKVMLWVFEENSGAINFYQKHGFTANGKRQEALGSIEVMFVKEL